MSAYPECECGQLKIVGLWCGEPIKCPFCLTTPKRKTFMKDAERVPLLSAD